MPLMSACVCVSDRVIIELEMSKCLGCFEIIQSILSAVIDILDRFRCA